MRKEKILIVADGHYGSTLPLAKGFAQKGYEVGYVILSPSKCTSFEALELNQSCELKFGLNIIDKKYANELYDYVDSKKFHLYVLVYPRTFKRIPIIRELSSYYTKTIIYSLRSFFRSYDYINLVGRYNSSILCNIINLVESKRITISLHEIFDHANKNYSDYILLKVIFQKGIKVVVHSKKTFDDWQRKYMNKNVPIATINFGIFETYRCIHPTTLPFAESDYVLFMGSLKSYKGLQLLYDSVMSCSDLSRYKFVIAGAGYLPVIDLMKNHSQFIILNKFLSNGEIAALLKNCRGVICPYTSVSQSGVVQTAFAFNKPIVASNIGSFKEVIIDGNNGYLFDLDNQQQLADKINLLYNDRNYELLINNVAKFSILNPEYAWVNIAQEYVDWMCVNQ